MPCEYGVPGAGCCKGQHNFRFAQKIVYAQYFVVGFRSWKPTAGVGLKASRFLS